MTKENPEVLSKIVNINMFVFRHIKSLNKEITCNLFSVPFSHSFFIKKYKKNAKMVVLFLFYTLTMGKHILIFVKSEVSVIRLFNVELVKYVFSKRWLPVKKMHSFNCSVNRR